MVYIIGYYTIVSGMMSTGLWCLTPQYFKYIVAVSFINGGNQCTLRKSHSTDKTTDYN